jgi:hypothetical protein
MRAHRLILLMCLSGFLAFAPTVMAQGGHFEFGGHYGRWSLNILGNTAEKFLNDAIDTEIQDRILERIQEDYPSLSLTSYDQSVVFDSSGDDFGAGIRWYPGGHRGSFSLGVSVEKSSFKVLPTASASMSLQDSGTLQTADFAGTAQASALVKALSFLVTLRWDIFPSKAIHPYLTFGLGASTAKALDDSVLSYAYSGQITGGAVTPETISGTESKTLRELRDEALADEDSNIPIPNFLPFVQLNLGLKARLTKMVHVLIDVGVFDGFMASAGLAIRL